MFAAIGIFGEVVGCFVLLAVGIAALGVLHNRRTGELKHGKSSEPRRFVTWFVCVLFFAGFVVALAPFASLPAVIVALLVLSPLFGTMIMLVSQAMSSLANRAS